MFKKFNKSLNIGNSIIVYNECQTDIILYGKYNWVRETKLRGMEVFVYVPDGDSYLHVS